ncbi:hypothetical protein C8D88_1011534 [Lentzea atacamensis]|uniref:Transcriptional regulator, AbiEi antitoxin, Type IV TA system n=3 Tax=Pseudonocardiaceae TaxID=2070 RepID=A0A316ID09_9PSEU|nr:hypothetical protein C8D88_1011534 [Lentzea atacamensis]
MGGAFINLRFMKAPPIQRASGIVRGDGHHVLMDRGAWDRVESELWKHSRFGVIRASVLETLGISQTTTYRQCQPGGRWRHLLPGVVMLARSLPTTRQRIEAALTFAKHQAVVTGFQAARLYGLRTGPDPQFVHLLIPHESRVLSSGFTVLERTRFFPVAMYRDGVPLAPPPRAVLDGVRRIRDLDAVRALLIEAVQSGQTDVDQLRGELDTGTKRGTALPRRVLGEIDLGVRSVAEADALELWHRAGLPTPHRNVVIVDENGNYVGMPDTWCDEVGLAWEIDSSEFHYSKDAYARTLERNSRYAAVGISVVQTLPSRLRKKPDAVVAELRAAYAAAQARTRPPVCIRKAGST